MNIVKVAWQGASARIQLKRAWQRVLDLRPGDHVVIRNIAPRVIEISNARDWTRVAPALPDLLVGSAEATREATAPTTTTTKENA